MFSKTTGIALMAALACFAQGVDPKGIFVTPGKNNDNRPAVKYGITLIRNGEPRPVAASYRFQSGDRFQFQFETSESSFVYLLTREIEGDPDSMQRYVGAKGIQVVRDDDRRSQPKYQVLWPTNGENIRLAARQPQAIPNRQYFQFDNNPGLEKIVLVVSPKPLDIDRELAGTPGPPPRGNGGRKDSEGDVMGQLTRSLAAMDSNAASAEPVASKGVCVGDCASYSAPKNPSDPYLVVIDLRHFR